MDHGTIVDYRYKIISIRIKYSFSFRVSKYRDEFLVIYNIINLKVIQ